ncbi:MAG: hypothetical protein JNL18_25270 [Planctomycetaceae bacterium]|nr:hypothetical protein [Planctomycetaceae bacterium]
MNDQATEVKETQLPTGREARLAAYLAAAGGVALLSGDAQGAVVGSTAVQPFGINGEVGVDFNGDGQIDFQIDHDRYNLNGSNLDYLQIDKNDVNSETNPLPIDGFATFPAGVGAANDGGVSAYAINGPAGSYPAALTQGTMIGPSLTFDFQEGDNFLGGGTTIRANRLIDEDATQIDQVLGGLPPEKVTVPSDGPNFLGLNGAVRYLGLKMDLNNANLNNYGWIGIRIDNEADATGAVVGWGYETEPDVEIMAGDTGPVAPSADYNDDGKIDGADFLLWQRTFGNSVTAFSGADGNGNGVVDGPDLTLWKGGFGSATVAAQVATAAVPEPSSALLGGLGGLLLVSRFAVRRWRRRT